MTTIPLHNDTTRGAAPADAPSTGETRQRTDRIAALAVGGSAVVGGLGYAAGTQLPADLIPDTLVWTLAGVCGSAGVLLMAASLVARWLDDRRYAGNEVNAVYDSVDEALAAWPFATPDESGVQR